MLREEIIKKAMLKLSILDKETGKGLIEDLVSIYGKHKKDKFESQDLPREIIKYVGDFMDKYPLEQKDKLLILAEAKRNKLFDFTLNKNLERAWRSILKKWGIPHYRLEGGI